MPTYLHIHEARTDTHQRLYRSEYELRSVDYELSREVNAKGEIDSDMRGGRIRAVIDGFGGDDLFHWLFRPDIEENGEIVTVEAGERMVEKLRFSRAKAVGYRLHFDAGMQDAVAAIVTIDAKEIETDNELFYERKR
jgi:hypothetical protein